MVELEMYSKISRSQDSLLRTGSHPPLFSWECQDLASLANGVLIHNLLMNLAQYHDFKGDPVFDELHYWTGSAKLDINLDKLKRWTEDVLDMVPDKNPAIHDVFNQYEVREVIEKQRRAVWHVGKAS